MSICLYDAAHDFWQSYHGSGGSSVRAYEYVLDRAAFYRKEYSRFAVCWDSPKSHRREAFDAYKANRKPKPQDALDSLDGIKQRLVDWGVPVVEAEGFEADDIQASLCTQAFPEPVTIISNDKDMYCLICDSVVVIGSRGTMTGEEVMHKFGVAPSQMTEWLALVGDASDNVPGCPNCGPGRASDLLARFGTIAAIKEASDDEILSVRGVGPKTLAGIREWDPTLALKLVKLRHDAPVLLEDIWPRV